MIPSSDTKRTVSTPKRRASVGTAGANRPRQTTGNMVKTLMPKDETPRSRLEQRHRGYGRTQIESDQQHGHNRPGGMAQYSRRPPMGSAAVFRTAMPRPGLIGKDVHRSFIGRKL